MSAAQRPARAIRPIVTRALHVLSVTVYVTLSVTLSVALSLALTACALSASETSDAPGATTPATRATPPAPPTEPQPTPVPPGSFAIYTNTAYGYSISYPRNWSVEGADASAQSFIVFNYDPQTYQQPTSAPPLLKIEIDAVPDPSGTPALDLFKRTLSGPGQPPAAIVSAQAAPLANDTATLIVWTSAASQYPTITYVLIPRHSATALFLSQSNAASGQPSPVFIQMLASLTVSG